MNEQDLKIVRHSAAHLLAHALIELYPETQLTIGPATEAGFFYDILPSKNFKEADLALIEQRMHEIAQRNLPITHEQILKSEAQKLYKDNPFKLELINDLEGDTVGLARQGEFYDLCRGGHVAKTGDLKYFKLTALSGSYWRANRDGVALQRISGIAFLTQEAMDKQLLKEEQAQMYDHRKLGKQLELFSFHDEGVGFPFFHPKGKVVLNQLRNAMRERLRKAGYLEIETPIMLSDELWRRSGHYNFYKENMYFSEIDEKSYAVRPMNCPGSILIYKDRPRSYRELPLRLHEFGKVHRHELSGVLHGLFRVRSFTIDDTHIYCTIDQVEAEILKSLSLLMQTIKKCGFENIKIGLSTKPEKAMGDDAIWQKAIAALKSALNASGVTYTINEGDGAFYGPKIDFRIEDSMERQWQCGTIQLDFFQPENFDLSYVSSEGTAKRPVILHQAFHGSFERFFGILLEHHKGHLPFWLAPVQAKILTVTDEQKPYAQKILSLLQEAGIRVELDQSGDTLSGQIKDAQLKKIPWMLIIGKKEVELETITIRYQDGKQEMGISYNLVLEKMQKLL